MGGGNWGDGTNLFAVNERAINCLKKHEMKIPVLHLY